MKNRKNNKGFSLVELIVVVLIMAIIAVALAPQVMKWVERSRQATDVSNYDGLVANLQLALLDKDAYGYVTGLADGKVVVVTMDSSSTSMAVDGTALAAGNKLYDAMTALDGSWTKVVKKASATSPASYKININNKGTISKDDTNKPAEVASD